MRVGALHRRLDRLPEQLVHELADERPHLFHRLREDRGAENHIQIQHGRLETIAGSTAVVVDIHY